MAEEQQDRTTDTASEDLASSGQNKRSLIKVLLLPAAVISVVVVAECALAYMYLIPSPAETAQMVVEKDEAAEGVAGENAKEGVQAASESHVEVKLGPFAVSAFQPLSNTTIRIDFELFATVEMEELEEFKRIYPSVEHRIREQVLVTVRSANINDLTDAGLGLIKRKILDKTNRVMGKPYLKTVVFSDFSFVEQ